MEDGALETIAFLARSQNRAATLRVLGRGPKTGSELRERIGASRVTIDRILADFERRSWIESARGGYVLTAPGRLVLEGFETYLERTAAARRLTGLIEGLPTDCVSFDPVRLTDGRVTDATATDPFAPLRVLEEALEAATAGTFVTDVLAVAERPIERSANGGGEPNAIVFTTNRVVETLRGEGSSGGRRADSTLREGVRLHATDRAIPISVASFDETVALVYPTDAGFPRTLTTTDSEVRAWVTDYVDSFRRDADRSEPAEAEPAAE